jgi:predicted permease
LAEWLVQHLLHAEAREVVAGDLEEEYRRVRRTRTPTAAAFWYWHEALRSIVACRLTGRRSAHERRHDSESGGGASLRDLVRPAIRQFRTKPLYALTCVGTLALAIGTASASFAVVKRAFLDPMPYAEDESLVSVLTASEGATTAVSPHVLVDLTARRPPLTGFAPIRPAEVAYSSSEGTEHVTANLVTVEYFDLLGIRPAMGRVWSPSEPDAVLVSWRFWRRAMASDPGALGKPILLDGRMRTVAGVLAETFIAPYWPNADLWMPLDMAPLLAELRTRRTLTILARRAAGASQQAVDAYLSRFSSELQQEHPVAHARQRWVAIPLRRELVGDARPALIGTAVGAGLLLLIVAANIAGLSTAQAIATRHQLAVRAALGATGRRLFVEQLAGGVALAAAGAAGGVGIAYGLLALVAGHQQHFLDRLAPVALDATTIGVGIVAGLAIGLIAALVPRPVVAETRGARSLGTSRSTAGDLKVAAARSGLVMMQVALAVVLVVGAGLLWRTVYFLTDLPLGFRSDGLTTFTVNLPGPNYRAQPAQIQFERRVLERLASIPGVTAVSASVGFPVVGGMGAGLALRGEPSERGLHEIAYFSVSPEFVSAVGARIVEGRDLTAADDAAAPRVVLINETMARTFWPNGDAIGAQVQIGAGAPNRPWITVVGVVADIRQHGPTEAVRPTAFGSTLQYTWPRRHFTVRTHGARPPSLARQLREALHAIDPTLALGVVAPVEQMVSDRTARHELVMLALSIFATVALVLCAAGLYAVVAMTSQLRRREYAIRLALGAQRSEVRWMVLRQAILVAGTGAAAGVAVAALSTRLIRGLLHGVAPIDAATFAAAAGVLLCLALFAAWQPARQAARVDPVGMLKAL